MYARIVVPVDGSDGALAAPGPARRPARLHQAELSLVIVATPDTTAEEIETIVAAGQRVRCARRSRQAAADRPALARPPSSCRVPNYADRVGLSPWVSGDFGTRPLAQSA
jgi:nucleotide-binding universal stress UspA family protein